AEVPALHAAGETLADGRTGHIDELAFHEVVRPHRRAHLDELVGVDPELGDVPLGLDLGNGELTALGLVGATRLGLAGTELDGCVTVLLLRALASHLAVLEPEHGHRHVRAVLPEYAGHTQLLCDQPGTHRSKPSLGT